VQSQKMKKPPFRRFFEIRFGLVTCRFYVNLPLLHRRLAGIAKVKIKVEKAETHGVLFNRYQI
jgi:hypothetical protein